MSVWKIKFKGQDFLLIGDMSDGAIATPEQYENFLPSYAHLFPNDEVRMYNKIIGNRSDIQFLEEVRK